MSDDYETPRWLLEVAFPNGYFDPCPIHGKQNGPDGLKIEWPADVPVFINPPYSGVSKWIERAEQHAGPVALLLLVDPSAPWWDEHARNFRVTLITQKIRFKAWKDAAQSTLTGGPAVGLTFKGDISRKGRAGSGVGGALKGAMLGLSVCWWYKP